MTTEAEEKGENTGEEPGGPQGSRSRITFLLTLMILLGLSAYAVFVSYETRKEIFEVRSMAQDSGRLDRLTRSLDDLQETVSGIRDRQAEIESAQRGLMDEMEQSTRSLQALYDRQNDGAEDWALAEIRHLMSIAVLRLTLEKDVNTALTALEQADQRLAELGDPGLFRVRRYLAAEMNALRSVSPVDITGVSLYLNDIGNKVDSLPLADTAVTQMPPESTNPDTALPVWKRLLTSVWNEFKGMFTITRTGENNSATLLPDEKYFLFQNLRLQLESARLALLQRDTRNFRESLSTIRSWLEEYFEADSTQVTNILQALERMGSLELDPELPVLGTARSALVEYMSNGATTPIDPGIEQQ